MAEYNKHAKPWAYEPHYSKHVNAMTAEGLHDKGEIALELAIRDQMIENRDKIIEDLEKLLSDSRDSGLKGNQDG